MKLFAIPAVGLLLGLLSIPALFATGDIPRPTGCGAVSGPVEVVLVTIRTLESGGDYTAQAARSTASGAYQFLDSTWNNYRDYPRAWQAPPAVQDVKAAEHVQNILDTHAGDVAAVPVVWYIGHVPDEASAEWDTIPAAGAGNRLTPRQYQTRWLDTFYQLLTGTPPATPPTTTGEPAATSTTIVGGCVPGVGIAPVDGDWSYPGPADLFAIAAVDSGHHDYPAWDWMLPTGTPIYAVRTGTVTTVQYWPHNWWDQGCTPTTVGCATCGIGVTITDNAGIRWAYCHGSDVHVNVGDTVTAGAQILTSGNTGRSGAPHLHLQIRTPDGRLRCPQFLLRSLRDTATGVDPVTLPTTGCFW